jgi:hypothetical protein
MLTPTGKTELQNLIPTMWSTQMYDELRASLLLGSFFMRDYEGEIANQGDTVKVNQIQAPTGENLEFGVDNTLDINSEAMVVVQKEVKADRLATASFLIENLASLQSLEFQAKAREALVYAVAKQVETYIQSILVPVAGNIIAPAVASDLGAGDIANLRRLLSKNYVPKTGRALFLDVDYYSDIIQKTQFASSDFVPAGSPTATGEFSSPLYGFGINEHDFLGADIGFACHNSAVAMVMQTGVTVKLSDMHPSGKRGYLMTADVLYGAKLFDNKRIAKISG